MLKIYRVFRFTNLIQKLNVTRESKAIFKALLLIFFLVLFLHIQACMMFYMAKLEEVWIPNMDFIYGGTNIYERSPSIQYWVVLYYSAMLFSISDMVAASTPELANASVFLVISVVIVANVFGLIASFVA